IRVVLTNLDRVPIDSTFFGTNPFVLPVLNNSTNSLYLTSSSYIDLPLISTGTDVMELSTPGNYELSQNYPNPFNPVTSIQYSIASASNVELKVYDVLGREIRTLVNNFMQPGSYNVDFDASNLSSGIYFNKLTAGNFTAVKRMVLVK